MAWNKYPYTDNHELNLDWFLDQFKQLLAAWSDLQAAWTAYKTDLTGQWEAVEAAWQTYKQYIDDYFANLNVQTEIDNKIDRMVASGEFLTVISPTVVLQTTAETSRWLAEHIAQETGYVLDTSLTVAGAAADAKAAGDAISIVSEDLENLQSQFSLIYGENYDTVFNHSGNFISYEGVITQYQNANYSNNISINNFPFYRMAFTGSSWSNIPALVFYDSSNNLISTFPESLTTEAKNYVSELIRFPANTSYFIVNNLHGIYATLNAPVLQTIARIDINLSDINVNNFDYSLRSTFAPIYTKSNVVLDHNNSFIDYSGVEQTFTNVKHSSNINADIFTNHVLKFSGATWSGVPAIAFFDINNNIIATYPQSPIPAGENYNNININVPENTSYIIINDVSSVGLFNAPTFEYISSYATKGWNSYKWVCVGDSLTEINQRTNIHYHDYIREKTDINVVNMGVSGTGYARGAESNNAFYQRILNVPLDADVITIFGSFNDLSSGLDIGNATDTGTTTLGGCINTTLDNLFSIIPLANVGVVTPTPWRGATPTSQAANDYCNLIINICKLRSIPCMDLFHESLLRPWDPEFRTLAYSKDGDSGVHPDENGHKLIAPRFQRFLEGLILSN